LLVLLGQGLSRLYRHRQTEWSDAWRRGLPSNLVGQTLVTVPAETTYGTELTVLVHTPESLAEPSVVFLDIGRDECDTQVIPTRVYVRGIGHIRQANK
jgi:hypothetical protein